jgi:hypothetical protein
MTAEAIITLETYPQNYWLTEASVIPNLPRFTTFIIIKSGCIALLYTATISTTFVLSAILGIR